MTNRIFKKFIDHIINNVDIDLRITEEYVQVSVKYMGKIVIDKKEKYKSCLNFNKSSKYIAKNKNKNKNK